MPMPHMNHRPWGEFSPNSFVKTWLNFLHSLPPGKRWRRLALWLRKPLKRNVEEWIDIVVWGLQLRLRQSGNLSEQRLIFMPQYLDPEELAAIRRELVDGGVFLDVGANAGVYSLNLAALRNPRIRIEAFEPDPQLCEALRFNLETNHLSTVNLNQIALGGSEGRVTLVTGNGNKGENHISSSEEEVGQGVEMTTLPSFLARSRITKVNALKIDVEGYECDVLVPLFSETPRQLWPQLLICEAVHDSGNRLKNLLDENGYSLVLSGRLNGVYRLSDAPAKSN